MVMWLATRRFLCDRQLLSKRRSRVQARRVGAGQLAYPVIEPGSWVMERKMLLTIKQRAERLARTQATA